MCVSQEPPTLFLYNLQRLMCQRHTACSNVKPYSVKEKKSRRLFLMRHGERLDITFENWISQSFDENGKYTPHDLNMPETVPTRSLGHTAFVKDTPVTKIGLFQAKTVGEAFKATQFDIAHVYASPALRCIQTCSAFLQGCNKKELKIKIEPGLFEWLTWHPRGIPNCITPEELLTAGYNIDVSYQPVISVANMKISKETSEDFYSRKASVARAILKANPTGNVLFVGHSSTLHVIPSEFLGKQRRTSHDLEELVETVAYCAFMELAQEGNKWQLPEPPFPSITHANNDKFEYSLVLN